jgi:hypothetical protein
VVAVWMQSRSRSRNGGAISSAEAGELVEGDKSAALIPQRTGVSSRPTVGEKRGAAAGGRAPGYGAFSSSSVAMKSRSGVTR